jgi:tetratricopeptide (TPR) repeat protein
MTAGTRLGPYEITAQIGVGGMGEVYRAIDTNLKRAVALKVLPQSVAADADRIARFQREAEVLASLNHSNIAAIYGLERSSGTTALVMELVEGPTLADRIAQGPIPVDEALPIAKQIAEALEDAHEHGIIHRDLKPANVKVRPDGIVKVLDFGLAKALEPVPTGSTDVTASPTMTSPVMMTRMGVILGTATYMSPEQARGQVVDKGTDIWAFGCVLYEMLTGQSAFSGETISDTIAKILERDPNWRVLPASTPHRIRKLLRSCLEKDQQHRVRHIVDARLAIQEARATLSGWRLVVGLPVVAAMIALGAMTVGGAWWYVARSSPPDTHEPVSVVIADFQNRTEDPTFDRALEPLLRIVLESATFINAYDRTQVSRGLGVRAPENLDESAAREIAVRQGLGVVLSGSLERHEGVYQLSVRTVQAVTGDVIASVEGTASSKDGVLREATKLVSVVQEALGDRTSDSARRFAMEALSATSLEVVHEYAVAVEALGNGQFEGALTAFSNAVSLDPKFGLAYAGMAIVLRNLGRQRDAEMYATEAVRHVDTMTERERYRTRGLFYLISGDYQACVREFGDLVSRYAADVSARNNLALCSTYLRDMPTAVNQMQRVVEILPKRALYRVNLALYAAYSSDFQVGEREGRTAQELGTSLGLLPLALSQLAQGQPQRAAASYKALGESGTLGASFSATGLADLALYQGHFSDAARTFADGALRDLASKDPDRAANKFAALAYTHMLLTQRSEAVSAAEKALAISTTRKIRFLVARVLVDAGELARARTLAANLASELQIESRAYAKVVEGNAALKVGEPTRAIKALTEANDLLDTWIGHFDLARAYLEANAFTQADSEFDRCIKRRGEALALFLDEEATFGYFPPVFYYQGRAREAMRTEGFDQSYRTYVAIRGNSMEDPLVQEARRRGRL